MFPQMNSSLLNLFEKTWNVFPLLIIFKCLSFSPPQLEILEAEQLKLPMTRLMLENASFLMQGETTEAWPLVCDPTSRVINWIKDYLTSKGLVEVKYSVSDE